MRGFPIDRRELARERKFTALDLMVIIAITTLPLAAVSISARSCLSADSKFAVGADTLLILAMAGTLWSISGIKLRRWGRWIEPPLAVLSVVLTMVLTVALMALFLLSPIASLLVIGALGAMVAYLVTWV